MALSRIWLALLVIISIVGVWGNIAHTGLGLDTLGYTYPLGDITIEYGQPLNITCILYDNVQEREGKNASNDIHFFKNGALLPKEMVEVINSTSARLYIKRPSVAANDVYGCNYKKTNMICTNVVSVGLQPQNVTDFSCVSRNYDNLTCTWTPPNNAVQTNYNLTFTLKGRSFKRPIRCPKLTEYKNKISCTWTISSEPPYRSAHPTFNFNLAMSNSLGNNLLKYQFNHFKHVIPNAPRYLTVVPTGPHSLHLSWELPSSMTRFPPGVYHRILYQCEYYPKIWHFGGLIQDTKRIKNISFDLLNLKYAHALCDIKVSLRSSVADPNDDSVWSDAATATARTNSKIPDSPPKTNVGSFHIVNIGLRRNIYVYWEQIGKQARNGQNFHYKVQVEHPPVTSYSSNSVIELRDLPEAEIKISVWSQNDEGTSLEKSTLVIPARKLPEPQSFITIAHSDFFELNWNPPTISAITNYTIFWCRSEKYGYDCDGNLNWITVPNNTVQYNLTLLTYRTHQIGISANGIKSSSGIYWAECALNPGKNVSKLRNVGKLKNVWISRVGSNFIDIEWRLDCSEHISVTKGFIIYYCQIENIQTDCIDEMKIITIMNKDKFEGRVPNLKPYKTYKLMAAGIISDSTFSQSSEPLYKTTSEAAPSTPPLNVKAFNVTKSTIAVAWDPPSEINGLLKYYVVYLNGDENIAEADETNFNFTGLESQSTYEIRVKACTVACSNLSKPLIVTTNLEAPTTT